MELRSIDVFLLATWGIAIVVAAISFVVLQSDADLATPLNVAYGVAFNRACRFRNLRQQGC